MAGILALLAEAEVEGHDEAHLWVEVTTRLGAMRPQLPPPPIVPRRVHERLLHPEWLDLLQIDGAIAAIAEVVGPQDGRLWAELVALNLVAARLGALLCTHRVGRHVVAALQAVPPPGRRRTSGRGRRPPSA